MNCRRGTPMPGRLGGGMFYKSLQCTREQGGRRSSMAAEPKLAESAGGTDRSTAVPPDFGDVSKSESSGLDSRVGSLDARAQSALLQEAFEAPLTSLEDAVSAPATGATTSKSRWMGRAVKSAIGLAIIAVVGVGPMQRLLEFSSVDAVVNARLVSLRAPIDGKLAAGPFSPRIGATAAEGIALFRITNTRADRSRLDDLRRLVDQIESERSSIVGRLDRLKELYGQIEEQTRTVQAGRIQELEARVMDFKAQAEAAGATQVEAASTLERTRTLVASGAQTKIALERAQRD